MEKRAFGKTDMSVTALGFGGAEIGFQEKTVDTVARILGDALDNGLNVIDTAECYENSEELIGKAVGHRRSDYYLFTKCGHGETWLTDGWDAKSLNKSIDRSLKRLCTDYVDLLQLHSCSLEKLKNGDVIEVLEKAKKEGKTRYIGYSGDSEAARYAVETGAFDTLQTSINIADQEAIELTLPLAQKQDMGVIAKRPVANAVWRHKTKPGDSYVLPYWLRLQELNYEFINGKSEHQIMEIALMFTLSVPGVHTAIVGTAKPGRWLENAQIVNEGALDPKQFEAIRAVWKHTAKVDWVGQV